MTGEYPFRAAGGQSIWGPAPIISPLLIDTETLTVADVLKGCGYDTAVFGKWHLGFGKGKNDWTEPLRPGPQDLGFDYYFGMPVVNSAPPYVYVENDRIVESDPADPLVLIGKSGKDATPITPIPKEAAQRSPNAFSGAVEAHKLFNDYEVGTKLTEKATAWIKSREKKPFFAFFATTNIHHPFTPAKRFQGTSQAGLYGDFVHELDWIVGEVRKSLEEAGVADNTLILFTSDNGGMFNHGGRRAAELGHKINGDLLGSKFGVWEGGHRVPFIAWWPGKIPPGTVSDQLLSSVDLMATFAAIVGRELSEAERRDSINMLPALTGNPEKPLRTELVACPNKPSHMSLRKGKWMYIPARSDGGFTGYPVSGQTKTFIVPHLSIPHTPMTMLAGGAVAGALTVGAAESVAVVPALTAGPAHDGLVQQPHIVEGQLIVEGHPDLMKIEEQLFDLCQEHRIDYERLVAAASRTVKLSDRNAPTTEQLERLGTLVSGITSGRLIFQDFNPDGSIIWRNA